ncbi:MAG: sugar transferase [Elusimicrobia bacterium]|nr:sugar transferase [Elusimicrobiota bacterium]
MKRKFVFFLKIVYLFFDVLSLFLSYRLAMLIRFGEFYSPFYSKLALGVVVIGIIAFYYNDFYNKTQITYIYELFRVIRACTVSFLFVLAVTFYWRPLTFSRLMFTYFWLIGIALVFMERELLKFFTGIFVKKFFQPEKVVVIGSGKICAALRRRLKLRHQVGLWLKKLPSEKKIEELVKRRNFRSVIVAQFPVDHSMVVSLTNICETLGAEFQLVPDILELKLGDLVIDEFFGIPLLRLKPTPLTGTHLLMKNIFDVAAAILTFAVLMPFFVIVGILIKLDSPGPVIYSQVRRGKKGKDFKFYKFRTMFVGADKIYEDLRKKHYEKNGLLFKLKNDRRVTRVGKILRRWSIDEFPQFFNVLKGDMSIVGPRPQIICEAEKYDSSAKRRLRTKPGITGLWQVSGRSDLSYDEMVRLDLYYVQNWSMEEDFRIIIRTVPAIFSKRGAY